MELLSPAGTLEKLKTAFLFGADAVYAGVPDFSLRSRINDFTYVKIKQGVDFAHKQNKKVYATINIYAHNYHLNKIESSIAKYADAGVDALIISDPGVIAMAKQIAPNVPIHLSTQANCTNWQAAKFWHKQGVSRIILAREVSLKEIREIHEKVPEVELECFVHGAMCVSYSGRCILSKLFSDRSANQGWCSQPCRWAYKIAPADDSEKEIEIEQDQNGTYLLNSKDLCLIEHLGELQKAGISSVKIEGRTKSAYYVAAITKLYRQTINNNFCPPKNYRDELEKLMNRGYTSGFLFSEEKCEHNFCESHKKCDWQFVGEVVKASKNSIHVKIHNELFSGDEVEFVIPQGENVKFQIDNLKDAETGKSISEIHGGQEKAGVIEIGDLDIPVGAMMRKLTREGGKG